MNSKTPTHTNDPTLKSWIAICLRIGALAFGGAGRAMLYRDAIVKKREWLTPNEFQQIHTVAAVLPGSNLVNLAAYIGYKLFGNFGGVLGAIALCLPGALMALLIIWFVPIDQPDISRIFQGFSIGSIALFAVFIANLFTGIHGNYTADPLSRLKYFLRLAIGIGVVVAILSGVSFVVTLIIGLLFCLLIEFLA